MTFLFFFFSLKHIRLHLSHHLGGSDEMAFYFLGKKMLTCHLLSMPCSRVNVILSYVDSWREYTSHYEICVVTLKIWNFCMMSSCYGKCSKNSNTKVSDKMTYANSADPDQTAPEGAV